MAIVFIIGTILILILTLIFLILISTLNIEIKDLELSNMKKENALGYAVIISLKVLNKFKWIKIHLNDEKIRKAYTKMQLEKIDIKKLEQDFELEDLKVIKKIKPKLPYFNLNLELGVESPIITSFIIPIFSTIISIILSGSATNIKRENHKYKITPIYQNKNLYKIQFNCIIQVKMVHIINVIYIFIKKGRSKSNERTTSNRRSYGYSYE